MESENVPSLPDAHQQVRLGDNQASMQKWTTAIEHYSRAIEYFQTIQKSLRDMNLKSILQAQIVQCDKNIHICQLKDRSEQAIKAQVSSRLARAHSISTTKPTGKENRRYVGIHLKNAGGLDIHGGGDSLAAMMFPNDRRNIKQKPAPVMIKKTKDDSERMEELQMHNEAMKNHLQAALDRIDKLASENLTLRKGKDTENTHRKRAIKPSSSDQEDETENELEATI